MDVQECSLDAHEYVRNGDPEGVGVIVESLLSGFISVCFPISYQDQSPISRMSSPHCTVQLTRHIPADVRWRKSYEHMFELMAPEKPQGHPAMEGLSPPLAPHRPQTSRK